MTTSLNSHYQSSSFCAIFFRKSSLEYISKLLILNLHIFRKKKKKLNPSHFLMWSIHHLHCHPLDLFSEALFSNMVFITAFTKERNGCKARNLIWAKPGTFRVKYAVDINREDMVLLRIKATNHDLSDQTSKRVKYLCL